MARDSEVHAYIYIKDSLRDLDWNVANPTRIADGELYTQHECLSNPTLKACLGRDVPENVVVVGPNKFMVVEAKPKRSELLTAIKEAKEYAETLNQGKILAPIAVAVAGNPQDTFLVKTFYFFRGTWQEVLINGKATSGFLNRDEARRLVAEDTYKISDIHISDDVLYAKATNINEHLHNGSINKNNRARVMAALLLAMSEDTPIHLDNDADALIAEINAKVKTVLRVHGKEKFARCVEINTPPTPGNHAKFRKALLDTHQELEGINIRSAMNSGEDILGRFYEQFLKYGNGAKEIGIVLTPRHLTRFGAEALRVTEKDRVFDPACGTGGFLVSAYDVVRKRVKEAALDKFKKTGIYGIEQEAEVVALSLVNMIFRGDGKTNIEEGNCFSDRFFKTTTMTKALMNPPFALKKEDEKEYRFVDYGLKKLEGGGLLFAVIPSPIMFREKNYKEWRQTLLAKHTLKAVIKMPEDLFYPAAAIHTSIIVIEAHIPHPKDAKVLWGVCHDAFVKRKGVMKRSKTAETNMEELKQKIQAVLDDRAFPSHPREWILRPIRFDRHLECAPEQYLEDTTPDKKELHGGMRDALLNALSGQFSRATILAPS